MECYVIYFNILYVVYNLYDMGDRGATNFGMDSWAFIDVYTTSTRTQFNSIDFGIFLMKFVQLLCQSEISH